MPGEGIPWAEALVNGQELTIQLQLTRQQTLLPDRHSRVGVTTGQQVNNPSARINRSHPMGVGPPPVESGWDPVAPGGD